MQGAGSLSLSMNRRVTRCTTLLLPWLIILLVPELRLIALRQFIGNPLHNNNTLPWTALLVGSSEADAQEAKLERLKVLASARPNEALLQLKVADWSSDLAERDRWQIKEYAIDEVLKNFPDNPHIIASRLRCSTMWLRGIRYTQAVASKPIGTAGWGGAPFTIREVERAINVARHGQKVEPNNTFYDWIILYYLLQLQRDKEALSVLRQAAHKTSYDDHTGDDMSANLRAYELVEPLLSEERVNFAASIVLPHLSTHHTVNSILMDLAKHTEKAGDARRALQIYDDLLQLSRPLARCPQDMQSRAGLVMRCRVLTREPIKGAMPNPALKPSDYPPLLAKTAPPFAAYARANGRGDLALRVQLEIQEDTAGWQILNATQQSLLGIRNVLLRRLFASGVVSRALAVSLLLLIVSQIISALYRQCHRLRRNADKNDTDVLPSRRDTLSLLALILIGQIIIGVFLWRGLPADLNWMFGRNFLSFSSLPYMTKPVYLVLITFIFWPLLFALFWTSLFLFARNIRWRRAHSPEVTRLAPAPVGGFLLIWRLWFYAVGAAFACSVAAYALSNQFSLTFVLPDELWFLSLPWLSIVLGLFWLAWLSKRHPLRPTPWHGYGAPWLRQVWFYYILLGSWAYLTLLVASLPTRYQVDAQLRNYLKTVTTTKDALPVTTR